MPFTDLSAVALEPARAADVFGMQGAEGGVGGRAAAYLAPGSQEAEWAEAQEEAEAHAQQAHAGTLAGMQLPIEARIRIQAAAQAQRALFRRERPSHTAQTRLQAEQELHVLDTPARCLAWARDMLSGTERWGALTPQSARVELAEQAVRAPPPRIGCTPLGCEWGARVRPPLPEIAEWRSGHRCKYGVLPTTARHSHSQFTAEDPSRGCITC